MRLSRSILSQLSALQQKKQRYQNRQFLIEGIKLVQEALDADYPLEQIFFNQDIEQEVQLTILLQAERRKIPYKLTSTNDIQRISTQKNPEGIVAVAPIQIMPLKQIDFNRPSLYLWEINDPGNLGTILRCAAWFDIRNILLSPNSVDVFSPKAVRASMGAVFKLHLTFPVDFPTLREYTPTQTNFLAADITGAPLIQPEASTAWILIIGSESHGLPEAILQHIDRKICIPRIGSGESLNVGVAAGIILYQLTLKL